MRLLIASGKLDSKVCERCERASLATAGHILFEFAGLNDIRKQHWNAVRNVCSDQLWVDLKNNPIKERIDLLLDEFNYKYVAYWSTAYNHHDYSVVLIGCIENHMREFCTSVHYMLYMLLL